MNDTILWADVLNMRLKDLNFKMNTTSITPGVQAMGNRLTNIAMH